MENITISASAASVDAVVRTGCLMAMRDEDPWGNEPVTGPYLELAKRIREITGKVASRSAGLHGGVSHDTVQKMWQGHRPNEHTLLRFALGYGVDANELLKLAGYPPLPKRVREEAELYQTQEIVREFDPDDLPIIYSYSGLSGSNKKLVEQMIQKLEELEKADSFGGKVAKD